MVHILGGRSNGYSYGNDIDTALPNDFVTTGGFVGLDVTYLAQFGQFMAVMASHHEANEGLYYSYSSDGVSWTPSTKDAQYLLPLNSTRGAVHNIGFQRNQYGLVEGSSFLVYYGAGLPYHSQAHTWDIDANRIYLLYNGGDFNNDGKVDIYTLYRGPTGTQTTEAHILNGANQYQSFLYETGTALAETGASADWMFLKGDYNLDGKSDIYAIRKANTGTGTTEVHILNGNGNFQSWLLQTGTALAQTGTDGQWMFALGDYNQDGRLDIFCINKMGSSSKTRFSVLNGANNFQSFLINDSQTILGQTGTDARWFFLAGDYNNDQKTDLYAIDRGSSGYTKVYVLNGTNNFTSYLLQKTTTLSVPGTTPSTMFTLDDYNVDGKLDLYSIKKIGTASGKAEVTILNGTDNFTTYLLTNKPINVLGVAANWACYFVP